MVVEEGLAFAEFDGFDFGDEDGVIACEMFGNYFAGERAERVFEERNAGGGPAIADAEAFFGAGNGERFGKILGEGPLRFLEYVDAEAMLLPDESEQASVVSHADENE